METPTMNNPLVSVIIPSYNRFEQLKKTVKSILAQTYPEVEIIIVNDGSTQKEYYTAAVAEWGTNITLIHCGENTRAKYGYPCAGAVRNKGARMAAGEWLAFCDDDDIWLPHKLELQMSALLGGPCEMSATEGFFVAGGGPAAPPLYNNHYYFDELCSIFAAAGQPWVNRDTGFPRIWPREMFKIHNCAVTSSVVMLRKLFFDLGGFRHYKNGSEDYDLWLRATEKTNCVYVSEPCFEYYYNWWPSKHEE